MHITTEKERNKDTCKLRLNWWINNVHLCLDILIVILFTANYVIELTITVLWLETSKRVVKWFGGHTISTGTGYRTVASRVLIDNRRNSRVDRTNCDSIPLLRATVRSFHSRRMVYIDFDSRSNETRIVGVSIYLDENRLQFSSNMSSVGDQLFMV